MNPAITLGLDDWFNLVLHFLMLSPIAVGGGIAMSPDMHRYLVDKQAWLTDTQFTTSIAIAQSAPGPNILFIGVIGWNIGMNAGGPMLGLWAAVLTLLGMLIPSSIMTYGVGRWIHINRERRIVRTFRQGLSPIVVALLMGSGWILTAGSQPTLADWRVWLLAAVTGVLVWRTRIHLLWLLSIGAVLGATGTL